MDPRRLRLWSLLVLASAPAAQTGAADAEQARRLAEQGEIIRLDKLLGQVEQQHPGRVIEVELDREGQRWIYELELVDPGGRVFEMEFDATTGELLHKEMEDDD
jgi:uncharacterized membrane protein YkoI